jgi:hypothetical protein
VIAVSGPVTHAAVGALPRQTTPFSLFAGHLQVLLLPQPMYPLEVHSQTRPQQQLMYSLAAEPGIPLAPTT